MGAFLDKPKTEKFESHGDGNGIRWGVSAMQGWRMEMEDAHVCEATLSFNESYSFFGVFDGHAGPKVAQYCSENLLKSIQEVYTSNKKKDDEVERIRLSIREGFLNLDETLKDKSNEDRSGTTAIVCLVTPEKIFFGNCGDSRALLCRKNMVHFSTTDHKPFNEAERQRIEKAGGTVMMQRVNGSLAVSRALGDFDYKRSTELGAVDQLVSPEPEVTVVDRDSVDDQYLLLACDGIYDVMANEAVVEYVTHQLSLKSELSKICSGLIDTCLNKNSRDNMSVVLVTFPGAPTVSQDAIKAEEELQKEACEKIEEKIKEIMEGATSPLDMEENHVMEELDRVLPKRFNVYGKREWISKTLAERRKEKFGSEDEDDDRGYSDLTDPTDAPDELKAFVTGKPMFSPEHQAEPQVQSPLSDPDTPTKEGNKSPTIM